MQEKIMELALALGEVEEAEREPLKLLSQAAEAELRGQLREGIRPEDCEPAFVAAAAWMALAGLPVRRTERRCVLLLRRGSDHSPGGRRRSRPPGPGGTGDGALPGR